MAPIGKTLLNIGGLLLVICWALWLLNKRRKLIRKGYAAEGEVISIENSGDDIYFYATIKFETITGETVIKQYRIAQGKTRKIGDKLKLYYNPDKPTDFLVKSPVEKWIPTLILIVAVIILIIYFIFFSDGNTTKRI